MSETRPPSSDAQPKPLTAEIAAHLIEKVLESDETNGYGDERARRALAWLLERARVADRLEQAQQETSADDFSLDSREGMLPERVVRVVAAGILESLTPNEKGLDVVVVRMDETRSSATLLGVNGEPDQVRKLSGRLELTAATAAFSGECAMVGEDVRIEFHYLSTPQHWEKLLERLTGGL